MTDSDLRLALRQASLRRDWTQAEQVGRRIGWRLLIAALRQGLARLVAPARLRLR